MTTTEPPDLPGQAKAKRQWPLWVLLAGGAGVGLLAALLWWRAGSADATTRRAEAILAEARRQEQRNSPVGLARLLDLLPGFLGNLGGQLNANQYKGTHEFAEDIVKLGTNAIPPALAAAGRDSSAAAREVAIRALGDFQAPAALPVLTNAVIRDRAENVRSAAAQALTDLQDRSALPALLHGARHDAEENTRNTMISSFAALGGREVAPDLFALARTETNWNARASLAGAFGDWREESAVPVLAGWLKENPPATPPLPGGGPGMGRWQWNRYSVTAVVDAIGLIGGPAAYEVLLASWEAEEDQELRGSICRAFGNLGDARAQPLLLEALTEEDDVRAAAARALGDLGDPAAIPALLPWLTEGTEKVRRETVIALGHIGGAAAVPRLAELLRTERQENIRTAICQALGQIGDPAAVALILEALPNLGESHDQALWALGHLGDSNAIPALTGALTHKDRENRFAAAFALVEIGGPTAADALDGALGDSDEFARHGKACALTLLGRSNALEEVRAGLRAREDWRRFSSILALGVRVRSAPIDTAWWEPALQDSQPVLRRLAAEAQSGRVNAGLIAMLSERESDHRLWASRALMFTRDPAAVPALERAARVTDASAREAARLALTLIRRVTASRRE